jgi:hypothetical protein
LFHYCEWKLWGKNQDYLAWKGLSGFLGKEDIIDTLMEEGRKKGRETNKKTTRKMILEGSFILLQPDVRNKAIAASQKSQRKLIDQGLHALQNPEMRARKAAEDSKRRKEEFELGIASLQRPEVVARQKEKSSRSRSCQNSTKITCPHCGKTGGHTNMKRYHFDNCKFKGKTTETGVLNVGIVL